MENMTAMQIVIDKMKDAKENLPPFGFDDEFLRGFNKAFQMADLIAKQVGIPTEKQQIADAAIHGFQNGHEIEYDPDEYYTTTFKQE